MKTIQALVLLSLAFTMAACSGGDGATGPAGPEGPAGPQGPQGPQGPTGNANVTQYTFGAHNFATNPNRVVQVAVTANVMNQSAWFVYLVRSSGNVYPIPGAGLNGASDYRVYWTHIGTNASFSISKVAGTGEEYLSIRIVRVQANTVVSPSLNPAVAVGKLPDIDFNDYAQVKKYYGLPD